MKRDIQIVIKSAAEREAEVDAQVLARYGDKCNAVTAKSLWALLSKLKDSKNHESFLSGGPNVRKNIKIGLDLGMCFAEMDLLDSLIEIFELDVEQLSHIGNHNEARQILQSLVQAYGRGES